MSRTEKSLLALALLALFGVAASRVHSFDIFWQLQSGRYMVETKSFIYRDLFSLAADAPRWEHCWLHDVIFYGVYALFGYAGVSLLKGILVTATALALGAAARVRGASIPAILLVSLPAVFLTSEAWLERPQLWTFLFFALFVLVLEKYRKTGFRGVYLLIPLMTLWTNLHAGAVLAFPVMAAYLLGEGGETFLRRSSLPAGAYRKMFWIGLALLVALLLNPYGLLPIKTLFQAAELGAASGQNTQVYNNDWQATTFAGFPFFFYGLGGAAVILSAGFRRLSLPDLLLLGGLVLMGLKLGRHTPFLFLGAAALLPVYLDAAVHPLAKRMGQGARKGVRGMALAVAAGMVLWAGHPVYKAYGYFDTGLRSWHYPVQAAEFVREHKLPGNLYNSYPYGGYLMWALYPDYRVFFDGRQGSTEMFFKGLQVGYGIPGWQRVLDEHGVRTVVSKACTVFPSERYPLLDRLRDSPLWALVFADDSSLVFVRKDAVDPGWLQRYQLPKARIYDTVLSEAILLLREDPNRYNAYWEMAQIHLLRKDYPQAFDALGRYLALAPQRNPEAVRCYEALIPMMRLMNRGLSNRG